jgi:hypothetical protein
MDAGLDGAMDGWMGNGWMGQCRAEWICGGVLSHNRSGSAFGARKVRRGGRYSRCFEGMACLHGEPTVPQVLLSREIARLKKQLQRRRQTLTPYQIGLVLHVYVLTGRDARAASALYAQLCRRDMALPSESERINHIEEWYLKAPLDQLVKCEAPDSASEKCCRDKAVKWVAQYRAANYVLETNRTGVAPSSRSVSEQYVRHHPPCVDEFGERVALLPGSSRGQRKWMQRFRARWQMRLGRLKQAKELQPHEIGLKVPCCLVGGFSRGPGK